MVSLSADSHGAINSGSRGAFFFDDLAVEQDDAPSPNLLQDQRPSRGPQGPQGPQGSINGDDDDVMLIPAAGFRSPSGGSGGASDFSRLKTPLLLLLEILLFVGVLVAAFVLPRFLQRKAPDVQPDYTIPYYILLYGQSMLWFVIFIIDRALWLQHRKSPEAAFQTKSGSALVTAFNAAIHSLDKNNVVQMVVTVEVICALVPIFILLLRTMRFNGEALRPDVQQEDAMMQSAVPGFGASIASDVGFRDASLVNVQEGDSVSSRELIEKQADQIRYLKSQCANLSRKCLKFQAQIDSIREQ